MVLKNNAFNWKTKRFEYQGRLGLVTGLVNWGINREIHKETDPINPMLASYLSSMISEQLANKGLPGAIARDVGRDLVCVLQEKFK